MTEPLKFAFDMQSLKFDRIEIQNYDIVAVLKDAGGAEYPVSRETFLCNGAKSPSSLTGTMKQAYDELFAATRETFNDLLLCYDYARWMHAVELEKGVYSLSFHVYHSVLDHDATNFILTTKEVSAITSELTKTLADRISKAPCVMQNALEVNRDVLFGIVNPGQRKNLGVAHRFTSRITQPPPFDLKSV